MNKLTGLMVLGVCILSAGCASTPKNEVLTEDGKSIAVYKGVPPVKYDALTQISAMDCAATWLRRANEENALHFLKQKAVAAGGNAIASLRCRATGMSFKYNCNNSYTCEGAAVKVD